VEQMSQEKIFLSLDEQVMKLEERNLYFASDLERKNAKYTLQNNSYYAVINGYKDLFCPELSEGEEDDFCNESFLNLRDSYDFDKELSALLFKYLLRIEDSFKAIFSYYTGKKYGHDQTSYLSNQAIRKGKSLKKTSGFERDVLRDILNTLIHEGLSPQLIHYRNEYSYTPPWVLASCVSLDSLIYWYKLSNRDVKEKTVSTMLFDYTQFPFDHLTDIEENMELFINLLMIVKEYRNRAAHGNRIMNHRSAHNIKINLLQLYAVNRNELINVYDDGFLNGDVFSLFLTVALMLSKRGTVRSRYLEELQQLFNKLKCENEYLHDKVLCSVGIPRNFIELLSDAVPNQQT